MKKLEKMNRKYQLLLLSMIVLMLTISGSQLAHAGLIGPPPPEVEYLSSTADIYIYNNGIREFWFDFYQEAEIITYQGQHKLRSIGCYSTCWGIDDDLDDQYSIEAIGHSYFFEYSGCQIIGYNHSFQFRIHKTGGEYFDMEVSGRLHVWFDHQFDWVTPPDEGAGSWHFEMWDYTDMYNPPSLWEKIVTELFC